MGWEIKARGPRTGYYYKSVRMPDKPYPVKVYLGRHSAGHEAAAAMKLRKEQKIAARAAVRIENDSFIDCSSLCYALPNGGGVDLLRYFPIGKDLLPE